MGRARSYEGNRINVNMDQTWKWDRVGTIRFISRKGAKIAKVVQMLPARLCAFAIFAPLREIIFSKHVIVSYEVNDGF